ncbi:MAG: hypothetical protein LBG82_08455, partial [Clostridiales Family XIII bacterium]|nr:hypothetical protein [Clostridiales Family XIII bacterium]
MKLTKDPHSGGVRGKKLRNRLLAAILTAAMLVTFMPSMAFADGGDGGGGQTVTTTVTDLAAQLAEKRAAYDALSDLAKGSQAGQSALAEIERLKGLVADMAAAEDAQAGFDAAVATAQADVAKYAEGTVSRAQEGSVFSGGYTVTFTLTSLGGEYWRNHIGFTDGKTTITFGKSYTALAEALVSRVGIFVEWQNDKNSDLKKIALDGMYLLDDYSSRRTGANNTLNEVIAAAAANEALYSAEKIAEVLSAIDALDEMIAAAVTEAYTITLSASDVPDVWMQPGESKTVTVELTNTFPAAEYMESFTPSWSVSVVSSTDVEVTGTSEYIEDGKYKFDVTLKAKAITSSPVKITINVDGTAEPGPLADDDAEFNVNGTSATIKANVSKLGVAFEGNGAVDGELPNTIDITEVAYSDKVFTLAYSGGTEPYTVTVTPQDDVDSRIAFRTSGTPNTLTVGKDTNTGTYVYDLTVVDRNGLKLERTVTVNVHNAYDDKYAAMLAELESIQSQVDSLMSLVALAQRLGVELPDDLASIVDQFSDVTGPFESMWNSGNPKVDAGDIREAIRPTVTGIVGIVNVLGKDLGFSLDVNTVLNDIVPDDISVTASDKKSALEGGGGYAIDVWSRVKSYITSSSLPNWLKSVIISAVEETSLAESINIPLDAAMKLYYESVTGLWGYFQEQVAPLTNLIGAFNDLSDYVTGADYSNLKSVSSINAYIQGLYAKYAAFDSALNAFNDSDSILAGFIKGLVNSADGLLDLGLDLIGKDGGTAIADIVGPLIDQYVDNEQISAVLKDLLAQGIDGLATIIREQGGNVDLSDLSMDKLVEYSAKVKDALFKVAQVSALIDATVNMGKDFDFAKYDFQLLDMLSGLAKVYGDYLSYVDGSALGNEDVAAELLAQIGALKDRLKANSDYQTAVSVYNEIVKIYGKISAAIDYFGSDQPKKYFEAAKAALIAKLEALLEKAKAEGKEELKAYLTLLIAQVREAAAGALANLHSSVGQAIQEALDKLEPYLDDLEGAYADLVEAYENAKEIYRTAVLILQDVREAYESLREYIAKAVSGFDSYKAELIAKLEELAQVALEKGKTELKERIYTLIAQVKNAAMAELVKLDGAIHGALAELLADLEKELGEEYAKVYAKVLVAYEYALEKFAEAYQAYQDIWQQVKDAVNDAQARAEALMAAIDAIIRAIPNPHILVQGDTISDGGSNVAFTTDVNWLFDVLDKSLGVRPPVYVLESAVDADGADADIFELSKDGKLTLKEDLKNPANYNGKYDITVSLKFETGYTAVNNKLNNLFGKGNVKVTVRLDLDKDALKQALLDGTKDSNAALFAIKDAKKTAAELQAILDAMEVDFGIDVAGMLDAYELSIEGIDEPLATLVAAIEAGLDVFKDADATQAEVGAATAAINDARKTLEDAFTELTRSLLGFKMGEGKVKNFEGEDAGVEAQDEIAAIIKEVAGNDDASIDDIEGLDISDGQKAALLAYWEAAQDAIDVAGHITDVIGGVGDPEEWRAQYCYENPDATIDDIKGYIGELQEAIDAVNEKLAALADAKAAYEKAVLADIVADAKVDSADAVDDIKAADKVLDGLKDDYANLS